MAKGSKHLCKVTEELPPKGVVQSASHLSCVQGVSKTAVATPHTPVMLGVYICGTAGDGSIVISDPPYDRKLPVPSVCCHGWDV